MFSDGELGPIPSSPDSKANKLLSSFSLSYGKLQTSGLPRSIIFFMVVSEHLVDDFPRGLFDGFVRSIDDFPDPVLLAEVPDILDICKDLLEFAVTRRERGLVLAHPPDFLKDLGIDYQTDDLLLIDFEKLLGQRDTRNDWDIGDLVALLSQKDRGRGLRSPRKSDDNYVRAIEVLGVPAVVVSQRILDRVDAFEVSFIDLSEQTRSFERFQMKIGREVVDQRAQNIEINNLLIHTIGGRIVAHLLFNKGKSYQGLVRLGLVEDLFEAGFGINVVEKLDLGVGVFKLHQSRPQNMQAALARSVGNNDNIFFRHVHLDCSIPQPRRTSAMPSAADASNVVKLTQTSTTTRRAHTFGKPSRKMF